jgi:hypothetical protein
MVNENKRKHKNKQPASLQAPNERNPSGWIQKYLDLADVLMKRLKDKRAHPPSKAA